MNELENLGWRNVFAAQLDVDSTHEPARVMGVHRDRIDVSGSGFSLSVPVTGKSVETPVTIGDWVLLDRAAPRIERVLERFGVFKRGTAGTSHSIQLIAANVDTLFIVTSANRDFNVARLERYLAIAHDASAFPIVVITKADTVDSVDDFVTQAGALSPGLLAEALDARSGSDVECLRPWCGPGQTVALLGSSGVGKSTLINTLSGATQGHTSCSGGRPARSPYDHKPFHAPPAAGRLAHRHPGYARAAARRCRATRSDDVFNDITALAADCRFADCSHDAEPGCAVQGAIDAGELDPERLRRFQKLLAEDRRNTETIHERRARDRSLGRLYRSVQSGKRKLKGGEN